MQNRQNPLDIIISEIKNKKMTEKEFLINCNINTSFLNDWKSGKVKYPSYDKIVKIAEYLNISLDYLLIGEEKKNNNMKIGDIKANSGVIGVNAPATITINNGEQTTKELSKEAFDLLKIFESLDTRERIKILNLAFELEENKL